MNQRRSRFAPSARRSDPALSPRWRWSALVLTALAATLLPAALSAQSNSVELTPHVGFRFGGSFDIQDFEFGDVDFDVEDSEAYGLTLDIPISRNFQIEVLYSVQQTELEIDQGLFAESFPLGDIDLEFYQVGALWQGYSGQLRPYASITGGVTRLEIDVAGTDSETRPSLTIGGGLKVFFSDNVGLRLDGRLFVTVLEDDDDFDDRCCRYYGDEDGETITQGQMSVGLIFAF